MRYLLSVGLGFEVCQSTLNFLRSVEPDLFKNPLNLKTEKRFMLCQGEADDELHCTEFDQDMAIAIVLDGRAVIPIQVEKLGKRLAERLQLMGSPIDFLAVSRI